MTHPGTLRRSADPLGARTRSRTAGRRILLLALAVLASAVLCVGIGPQPLSPGTVARVVAHHLGAPVPAAWTPAEDAIVWDVRAPRVLLATGVGAGLAVSGAALQAMVRNLLADPYVLGVSGGASTGAAAAILGGAGSALLGQYAQSLLAFAGALAAAALVLAVSRAGGAVTSLRLLIAGVAVGHALSAVTNLLIVSSDSAEGSRSVMFWMLGSLALARWDAFLLVVLAGVLATTLVLTARSGTLDALGAGDETALALGVDPGRARVALLVGVSACTAAAVAASGSIGFVGLVVPHLARRLVGAGHRRLIPAAALLGALFLLWADVLCRVLLQPRELPIGVITAMIGAPFLLLLVRRHLAR